MERKWKKNEQKSPVNITYTVYIYIFILKNSARVISVHILNTETQLITRFEPIRTSFQKERDIQNTCKDSGRIHVRYEVCKNRRLETFHVKMSSKHLVESIE